MSFFTPRHWYGAATVLFIVVFLSILAQVDPALLVAHAADSGSWIDPAKVLLQFGSFISPGPSQDAPAQVWNYRPPMVPLFVALAMWLSEHGYPYVVASLQAGFLLITASLTARMVETVAKGYGPLGFALLLFNPNSFGTAFFVQSETLNALFVALTLYGLVRFAATGTSAVAFVTGVAAGLSALTRPECQFLFVLVPVGLALVGKIGPARVGWLRMIAAGFVCLIAIAATTAPWMAFNYGQGHGYRLAAGGSTAYFIWGGATQVEMVASGLPEAESELKMRNLQKQAINDVGTDWSALTEAERNAYLASAGLRHILSYDAKALATTITKATLQFLSGGGAGRLFVLAGQPGATPFAIMSREKTSDHLSAVLSTLNQIDGGLLFIWITAFGYVIVSRIFGLGGLYLIARNRQFDILLIVVAGIGFFAMVTPFYGISRFRVSVECLFVLLSVAGIAAAHQSIRRRRESSAQ